MHLPTHLPTYPANECSGPASDGAKKKTCGYNTHGRRNGRTAFDGVRRRRRVVGFRRHRVRAVGYQNRGRVLVDHLLADKVVGHQPRGRGLDVGRQRRTDAAPNADGGWRRPRVSSSGGGCNGGGGGGRRRRIRVPFAPFALFPLRKLPVEMTDRRRRGGHRAVPPPGGRRRIRRVAPVAAFFGRLPKKREDGKIDKTLSPKK